MEVFTDVPEGSVRRADTIAIVPTFDGKPELVLIHVETQAVRRSEVRFRMFEYYMLLRLRYRLPVFPIVLYTLNTSEQEQFEQLLETPEATEARQMISIYEARGREAGREEGILIGKCENILTLLRLKFGALPPRIETNVRQLPTQAELDTLFARVVTANSLQEAGLETAIAQE